MGTKQSKFNGIRSHVVANDVTQSTRQLDVHFYSL